MSIGKSRANLYIDKDTGVTFDDVAGVDEAKEELKEVIDYLQNPQKYQRLGGKIPKGVLLVGPNRHGQDVTCQGSGRRSKGAIFLNQWFGVRPRCLWE